MAGSDWTYEIEKRADREISCLPDGIDQAAIDAIEFLLENPTPPFCIKLRGYENAYRIRFPDPERGPYRILYTVNRHRRFIRVFRVSTRQTAYRKMRNS